MASYLKKKKNDKFGVMLHDKDKHTSNCRPFLACCVLQFFLLPISKPLLSDLDELQK